MKEKEVSHKVALKGCKSVGGICALGEFDTLKREQCVINIFVSFNPRKTFGFVLLLS
jgi:hypothetical protein